MRSQNTEIGNWKLETYVNSELSKKWDFEKEWQVFPAMKCIRGNIEFETQLLHFHFVQEIR